MKLSKELLKRYWEDACTEVEKQFVENELLKAENASFVQEFLEAQWVDARHLPSALPASRKQAILQAIRNSIHTPRRQKRVLLFYPAWRWAAALVMLLSLVGAALIWQSDIRDYVIAQTTEALQVPAGKLYTVRLSDGSTVRLNSGSRFTYNKYMWGPTREVHLEGEAFFTVAKDETKPFIVHSGSVHTRVLGTSFNVKAIDEIGLYEVTVTTGKVQVSRGDTVLSNLLPTQRISFGDAILAPVVSTVSTTHYLQWQHGKMAFYDQSFEEIAWYLENRFGVNIEFENEVSSRCRFTGDFTGMTLNQILRVMREVHDFKAIYQHDTITISGHALCE